MIRNFYRKNSSIQSYRDYIYMWMGTHKNTLKARKAISILHHRGIKALWRAYKDYINNKNIVYNNLNDCIAYDSEYQDNIDYSGKQSDIKMLAFYLPQYHTFPENDQWWGKGFTEWTNVKKGDSRFIDHYQPRIPHEDIGYYCLDDIDVIRKQALLAKQHGIYGFCFYYYWFSGKRLMEKPVDMLLENKDIDLPFCLCWANENWTRAWDGQNKDILIAQEYSEQDDNNFILDLKKYIDDERYIRINGKPLIVVYNPGQIPNCKNSFECWRQVARKCGIGEILIWTCQTANNNAKTLKIEEYIDAEVEFPPHNMWFNSFAVKGLDLKGKSAFIYNYSLLVDYIEKKYKEKVNYKVPIHRSFMMAWDNAARRKNDWFTYYAFSLEALYRWVLAALDYTRKEFDLEERFVFINAWNEWGEGTYLEPDKKYGYANINTVSKALYKLPLKDDLVVINNDSKVEGGEFYQNKSKVNIAIQVHMFYLDTIDEIIQNLNNIPCLFDCYISTDEENKRDIILKKFKKECRCSNVQVGIFPNRGRDVAPFLMQMREYYSNYDFICHIHSKKTKTNDHGNEWRKYLYKHLFGNEWYILRLLSLFSINPNIGLIMPETYPVLELQDEWGGNKEGVKTLLERMNIGCSLPENPVFPVGNMFWVRSCAVKKIFDLGLTENDFPMESGQVNLTIAHQIERSWVYIVKDAGFEYCKVFNNCNDNIVLNSRKRMAIYVHYDKNNIISKDDIRSIVKYSQIISDIIFVSNSNISDEQKELVSPYVKDIIIRDNVGFDFGAWREVLLKYGKEIISSYDELVLINNSCFEPIFDIKNMFYEMELKTIDFWGNTIFPYSSDGSYIGQKCIYEHLQSYFLVLNKKVLESPVFWDFWKNIKPGNRLIDIIANCETKFTKVLADAGFVYEPYIRETYYISHFLGNYSIPYEKPVSLLLLKNPLVKKKCYQYMSEKEKIRLEYLIDKFETH